MNVDYFADTGGATIGLTGELDHHAAKAAVQRINALLNENCPGALALDLHGVQFMDSSGIALIFAVKRRMEGCGCTFALKNLRGQPLRVLKSSGLLGIIEREEEKQS